MKRRLPEYEVAMATFNGERYIIEQLDSIERQTRKPKRIIVFDDCSADNTVELINDWKSRHDITIELTVSAKRQGHLKTFAAAFLLCKADYIMPSDQDDLWEPDKAEKLLSTLTTIEDERGRDLPILVHSALMLIDDNGIAQGVLFGKATGIYPEQTEWRKLSIQNVVTGCALVINRACLERALPIPDSAVAHDWWLALVAKRFGHIYYMTDATVNYRQHDNNAIGVTSLNRRLRRGIVFTALAGNHPIGLIRPTLTQLQTFATRYKNELSASEKKHIEALLDSSPIKRLGSALRLRLARHSMIETVAFYACLVCPASAATLNH